ncbi:hypothetical protein C5167_024666 [Papaver somniferum]|uniref:Uncharacterized protein n=1 Tax=Papaver somniferum TaxID=3469 RepID=A0A4Y7JP61_PAPSO|nr:hypothetical protein C5167_024666 [Papaver somniferum]
MIKAHVLAGKNRDESWLLPRIAVNLQGIYKFGIYFEHRVQMDASSSGPVEAQGSSSRLNIMSWNIQKIREIDWKRSRKNALTEEEIQRDRERRRIAYHKRRHQTVEGEINDTKRQASTTAHAPSATSTSQSDRVPSVGSIYSSIKKSRESLTRLASSLECHQATRSRPRKSPRLIDQAQRQELIEAETEKGNDGESKLEHRRVRAREKRSALTEQEIERDLERRRNVYQRRRQQTVVGIEGNLPTSSSIEIEWMNQDQVLPVLRHLQLLLPKQHSFHGEAREFQGKLNAEKWISRKKEISIRE